MRRKLHNQSASQKKEEKSRKFFFKVQKFHFSKRCEIYAAPCISSYFSRNYLHIFLHIFYIIFPLKSRIPWKNVRNFCKSRFLGERGVSKIPILGGRKEIMGYFPEYDVFKGGGSKILKFVNGADQEQRHETCQQTILNWAMILRTNVFGRNFDVRNEYVKTHWYQEYCTLYFFNHVVSMVIPNLFPQHCPTGGGADYETLKHNRHKLSMNLCRHF